MRWWCAVAGAVAASFFCAASDAGLRDTHAYILVDAASGEVLAEQAADAVYPPGALANLMLLFVSLEQAALGTLPLDVPVVASRAAETSQSRPPGKVGAPRVPLRAGRSYLLSKLLRATLVTASDETALAAAEAIAGSVPECLRSMNARARRLRMTSTSFARIGDTQPESNLRDGTTARDMARLARSLLRHPEALAWASLSGMPFEHGALALRNVNELLGVVRGVDGLHVSSRPEAGFSIVATAERDGLRLIAVVLGAQDSATRYAVAADLVEGGFARYERVVVARKGEPLKWSLRLVGGSSSRITPVLGADVSFLRRDGEVQELDVRYQVPAQLDAPIEPGDFIGELVVEQGGRLISAVPVLVPSTTRTDALRAAANE